MHRVGSQRHLGQTVVAFFAQEPREQVARFLIVVDAARLERGEVIRLGLVLGLGGAHSRALGPTVHVAVLGSLAVLDAYALLQTERLLELLNDGRDKVLRRLTRFGGARSARRAAGSGSAQLHHHAVDQRDRRGAAGGHRRLVASHGLRVRLCADRLLARLQAYHRHRGLPLPLVVVVVVRAWQLGDRGDRDRAQFKRGRRVLGWTEKTR